MKQGFEEQHAEINRVKGLTLSKEEMDSGLIITYCKQCQATRKHQNVTRNAYKLTYQPRKVHVILADKAYRRCLTCGTVHEF